MRFNLVPFLALALTAIAACGGQGTTTGDGTVDVPGPKDASAAAKAAVFLGSCVPDDGINRTLNRIYAERRAEALETALTEHTACLAGKTNGCKAVKDCLGITVDVTGPCPDTCNGTVLQGCDDALKFQIDCAKTGLTCSAEAQTCIDAPLGPACDFNTYVPSCKDGAPMVCDHFETKGLTCADLGLVCGPISFVGSPPGNDVGCAGAGPACDTSTLSPLGVSFDNGIACVGTALRACVNGREHQVDCGALGKGFTCQTSGATSFCGLGSACLPGAAQKATCEGDTVVICDAGRVEKIDCKSLGFTGCDAQLGVCIPNGVSGL